VCFLWVNLGTEKTCSWTPFFDVQEPHLPYFFSMFLYTTKRPFELSFSQDSAEKRHCRPECRESAGHFLTTRTRLQAGFRARNTAPDYFGPSTVTLVADSPDPIRVAGWLTNHPQLSGVAGEMTDQLKVLHKPGLQTGSWQPCVSSFVFQVPYRLFYSIFYFARYYSAYGMP
jgi:hypothetical protein